MWERIKNLFNIRKFPHPERGNYLGANRRCYSHIIEKEAGLCPEPIDTLDYVGARHDYDTQNDQDIWADFKFSFRMLKINPFNKKNYNFNTPTSFLGKDYRVDPRIYQYGSALVIGTLGFISTPVRLIRRSWKNL